METDTIRGLRDRSYFAPSRRSPHHSSGRNPAARSARASSSFFQMRRGASSKPMSVRCRLWTTVKNRAWWIPFLTSCSLNAKNRDLRTLDGSIVHLRSNVVGMSNPCVEVRQVKHEQSFRSNVVAKVPKGFVHIRGRCKIVERRPEAKKRVKPAAQVKRLHFRPVHVGGDTRSLKVSPGDADHRLRSVPAHDLVTPLYQGKVDGESPAGDVEDISTDRMAVEQISQKGRCSSDAPRVVQSIVVFCDDPIPTGVGLSVLTSREPHAQ